MSGVAYSLDGSVGQHSECGVIPMSTADKLQNLERCKLLPLKQETILHKPKIYRDSRLLPPNQKVLRLRELLWDFMLLRDLLRMREL